LQLEEHNGWTSSGFGNIHFLNNVVAATRYVFEHSSPSPLPPGNVLDYNNLYTTDPGRFVKWENQRLNPAGFRELGFQQHGLSAPPRFRDPAGGDLRLLPDDPGIDQALPLPGINDGFCGPAPDLGAFEHCGEPETAAAAERPGRAAGARGRGRLSQLDIVRAP